MTAQAIYTVTVEELREFRGWKKFDPKEQSTILAESRELGRSLYSEGQSRLASGRNLENLSQVLSPKRAFSRFLRKYFHMTRQTAYNYINLWKAAAKDAPKPVLDLALSRNYRVVNRPEIFKTYPPPRTTNPQKLIEYLDRIETQRPKLVTIHKDRAGLLRQAVHQVEVIWRQVPVAERVDFARELIGMEMTMFGWRAAQEFKPAAVPEMKTVGKAGGQTKRRNVA